MFQVEFSLYTLSYLWIQKHQFVEEWKSMWNITEEMATKTHSIKCEHITVSILCLTIIPEVHENYILKVNAVILTNDSSKKHHQWRGNECRSWRWWPKVGPPPNRQQNAWSFMQKWSYCNTKIFLGAIQHRAGSCQNHYKQWHRRSEESYCNTRHYCMQFSTMWAPVKNTIYWVMHPVMSFTFATKMPSHSTNLISWRQCKLREWQCSTVPQSQWKQLQTSRNFMLGKFWVQVCLFPYIITVQHELIEQEWEHQT